METLIEIFEMLRSLNRCRDQREFSVTWLGRSKGYFAYLRSTGARPSLTSLALLSTRLREVAPPASDDRYLVERRRMLSAAIAADVMREGLREIEFVPRGFWCTAY